MGSPEQPDLAVPAMAAFCGIGLGALGFGAGYGARSYHSSNAYKDLVEKFPEVPTVEAEALARRGATRAFLGGTALAGLMGVGAVAIARFNGIRTAGDLGDAIKKWLPTESSLEVCAAYTYLHTCAHACSPPLQAASWLASSQLMNIHPIPSRIAPECGGAQARRAAAHDY